MTPTASSSVTADGLTIPEIPARLELDPERKRLVMGSLKLVLTRLQSEGRFREDVDYQALFSSPALLFDYMQAFKANRHLFNDLVVDPTGRPVADFDAPLVCGPTLAQIGRMLVYTCAKRQFASVDAEKPAVPAQAPRGMLASFLGRKQASQPVQATEDELKLNALEGVLAFDWQLPLLKSYYFHLDRGHVEALGRDLLAFRNDDDIRMLGGLPVAQITQVRRMVGSDFSQVMMRWPAAIRGLASVGQESFRFFRRLLGERSWEFFSRDPKEIAELLEGDRDILAAFGSYLADACLAAVQAFDRMSPERIQIFLDAFRKAFPAKAGVLLSDAGFCRQSLRAIAQSFVAFDGETDDFRGLVSLKCAAIAPAVEAYLAKRRAAEAGA